ncbi:hypothetical protein F4859DRAFT_527465 [Xylaria cf. heliscus]|nr:hypothetical protein F4859DRAFT_527465 [Xylaria cf. heliscus]
MAPDIKAKCWDTCYIALRGMSNTLSEPIHQSPSGYPFFAGEDLDLLGSLTYGLVSGPQPGTLNLPVQYCLARPLESVCRAGMSPALLLLVLLCVAIKTSIAILVTFVLGRRGQKPLVTLGDYIASSIERVDYQPSEYLAALATDLRRTLSAPEPRRWQVLRPRWAAAVSRTVWAVSYVLFAIAIAICVYLISTTTRTRETFTGSFLADSRNPIIDIKAHTFIPSVLIANSPQILFSLCYIALNSLFTYFCVATKWERFASNYIPLRVTEPNGEQKSSYLLQLPYQYSLPIMSLSILFHWLISNTIYVVVSEGGKEFSPVVHETFSRLTETIKGYLFSTLYSGTKNPDLPNTAVLLGYSPKSLIALTIVGSIVIITPLAFGFKRLSSDIVVVGTNSRLILMACRVSTQSSLDPKHCIETSVIASGNESITCATPIYNVDEIEESDSLRESTMSERRFMSDGSDGDALNAREKIARSKIRWGVLPRSPGWYKQPGYQLLGFGVEADEVTTPVQGRWYK